VTRGMRDSRQLYGCVAFSTLLFLSLFCACSLLLLSYWKKWLCAYHNQVLTGHVAAAHVLGIAFSTHVAMGEEGQPGGGRAGGRRASGRWACGRVIDAAGSTRKHSRMSSWEPMGGGRRGGGGGSIRKSPREPGGGGVREVPWSPREPKIYEQSSCIAKLPGSVTYTSGLRPGECFSVRYVTIR